MRKLARRTGYGEVFAVPDPAAAEAAVRARADAMADKLDARAQQEIGGLPFTSCAACPSLAENSTLSKKFRFSIQSCIQGFFFEIYI